MTRKVCGGVVAVVISTTAILANGAAVQAAPAAQICGSFKEGGLTFKSFTLGTRWTCSSAKSWIIKLSADKVQTTTHNVALTNGPHGYHCLATTGSRGGRATAGTCFTGTVKFPGNGFAWLT
jgi:hypothetical protein